MRNAREVPPGEGLRDHTDLRRRRGIAFREEAALDQANPEHAKIVGRRRGVVCREVGSGRLRAPLDLEAEVQARAIEGDRERRGDALDPGPPRDPADERRVEPEPLLGLCFVTLRIPLRSSI